MTNKLKSHIFFSFEGKTETYSEEYTLYLADISDSYANAPQSSIKRINFLEPIGIPELGHDQFVVFHLSPIWRVLDVDIALLGEVDKIVPISNDRILNIDFKQDQIAVRVQVRIGRVFKNDVKQILSLLLKQHVKVLWVVYKLHHENLYSF